VQVLRVFCTIQGIRDLAAEESFFHLDLQDGHLDASKDLPVPSNAYLASLTGSDFIVMVVLQIEGIEIDIVHSPFMINLSKKTRMSLQNALHLLA